jgi:HPt (histidine-containing phosphotransfer) domain-containing protein
MDSEFLEIPADARQRYIERRKTDLETLRTALRTRNFDEFKRIGHQLKGNAATFGYKDLEQVAIQLELAGNSASVNESAHQVELFEKWLNEVSAH